MLTDLRPETMNDEEVVHYAELIDDPWVKRLLEVISNLEIEVSYNRNNETDVPYNKRILTDSDYEEYPE